MSQNAEDVGQFHSIRVFEKFAFQRISRYYFTIRRNVFHRDPSQNGNGEAPLDGVPKFPAYNSQDELFMAINGDGPTGYEGWEIRSYYTQVTIILSLLYITVPYITCTNLNFSFSIIPYQWTIFYKKIKKLIPARN